MKKQKSGLYRTKVVIGHDENGKPINKWVSGKTKKELEQRKREIVDYYINGIGTAEDQLIGPYMVRWYEAHKKPFITPSTQRGYKLVINKYLIPKFGERNLRSVSSTDIQLYINTLSSKSKQTIHLCITVLRHMYDVALGERIVTYNPAASVVIPPCRQPKEKHVLTVEERAKVESMCQTHEFGLWLAMMYYTGIRIGECCALQWGDIDRKRRLLHIRRTVKFNDQTKVGSTKTRSSVRSIPIALPLMELINKAPQGLPNNLIFATKNNTPLCNGLVRNRWKDIFNGTGMDFPPHALRHNYLTMCYESGIDAFTASKLAGHSDISTTTKIYTHLSEEHMEKVSAQVDNMFSNKKVEQKLQQ